MLSGLSRLVCLIRLALLGLSPCEVSALIFVQRFLIAIILLSNKLTHDYNFKQRCVVTLLELILLSTITFT